MQHLASAHPSDASVTLDEVDSFYRDAKPRRDAVKWAVFAGIAVVVLAVWYSTWALAPDWINISRSDLEGARARWASQRIESYEMTVHTTNGWWFGVCAVCGQYTILVEGEKATLLDYEPEPVSTNGKPQVGDPDFVNGLTIDSMFDRLDAIRGAGQPICDVPPTTVKLTYEVLFDQAMGYPRRVSMATEPYPTRECGWLPWVEEITDLQIKSRLP